MAARELMVYTKEDEDAIWRIFGRTAQSAEEDVEIIKNWMKAQPHLPEVLHDAAIKCFLRLNKCSIEQTKEKIDNYYSIRHFVPELFSRHPLTPEMRQAYNVCYWLPLPKLVGLDRVFVLKLADCNPENLHTELLYSHMINFVEVRLLHECVHKEIHLIDFAGVKAAHLFRIPFPLLLKLQIIAEKVFSSRVRSVHVVNGLEALLSRILSVMKPKVRERVHIHKNYESIYEFVPKEVLPKDLGGEERSLVELRDLQIRCYEEMKERFDVTINMKSNEQLRPGKPVNDEFFGFHGNFKKLDVD